MAPAPAGASTSTLYNHGYEVVVSLVPSAAAATALPRTMYAVCKPIACAAGVPVSSGTYNDTATSASLGTARSTGSLMTTAPGGSRVEAEPPNVSGRSDSGRIAPPL